MEVVGVIDAGEALESKLAAPADKVSDVALVRD